MSAVPDVSVVMCVYNGAATLRDTLQSVLSQHGVDLELIVVDDGSTDRTGTLLNDCARDDARMRVLRQDNSGLTVGLIRGCEIARGRYIARQDAGDYSLDGRLRIQRQALDSDPSLSFVSCWTEVCGPEMEFLSYSKGTGRAVPPAHIISTTAKHGVIDGPSCHGSVMFRRDRYVEAGGYRREFYFGQDWDLWYRLGKVGKFQMIEQILFRICVTPDSLSGRYRTKQREISKLSHAMLLRRERGESEGDLLRLARAIHPARNAPMTDAMKAAGLYFIGEQLRRNGDLRAEAYLRDAIKICPTMLKAWIRLGQFQLTSKR
jgi:glycosyltransferase involved in cell wall biosynthesis